MSRHREDRDLQVLLVAQAPPEVEVVRVSLDDVEATIGELGDAGAVVVDPDDGQSVERLEALVGGLADAAHAEHDDVRAVCVGGLILRVKRVVVLCRQTRGEALDEPRPRPVGQ